MQEKLENIQILNVFYISFQLVSSFCSSHFVLVLILCSDVSDFPPLKSKAKVLEPYPIWTTKNRQTNLWFLEFIQNSIFRWGISTLVSTSFTTDQYDSNFFHNSYQITDIQGHFKTKKMHKFWKGLKPGGFKGQ